MTYPNDLQITRASLTPKLSIQTVPQCSPKRTSTLPSLNVEPPASLKGKPMYKKY